MTAQEILADMNWTNYPTDPSSIGDLLTMCDVEFENTCYAELCEVEEETDGDWDAIQPVEAMYDELREIRNNYPGLVEELSTYFD